MTANRHGLPEEELTAIRERDRNCVYCHVTMRPYYSDDGPRTAWATIEHFNGPPYDDPTQVAGAAPPVIRVEESGLTRSGLRRPTAETEASTSRPSPLPVRDYFRIYSALGAVEPGRTRFVRPFSNSRPTSTPRRPSATEPGTSSLGSVQRQFRSCDHPWCRKQADR